MEFIYQCVSIHVAFNAIVPEEVFITKARCVVFECLQSFVVCQLFQLTNEFYGLFSFFITCCFVNAIMRRYRLKLSYILT